MTLVDAVLVIMMVMVAITAVLTFTIFKGVGFKNLFSIFKAKMKMRKGWGYIRIINQTGIPENIPYQFDGKEFTLPCGEGKGKYIYKPHCLVQNEYGIPTISYRRGDAEPIDPRTGLQTVTSARMIEEIIARAIKAEQMIGNGIGDWFKDNWKIIAIGALCVVGAVLFVYMHMTDAIVEAGKCAGQTIVLNSTSLGK